MRPDVIETCAGAGGQALGLHLAGFAHRALIEIDPHACKTLRRNCVHLDASPDIVHEADLRTFPTRAQLEQMTGPTLLAGGVPCPPFSVAGRQLGADDERDLFPTMLKLARRLHPRAVMIENVRGLLDAKFLPYRQRIERRFNNLGYQCHWQLLNASDFGVPQLRPRTLLVALQPGDSAHFRFPDPLVGPQLTVGAALGSSMAARGWRGAAEWALRADRIAPTLVGGSKKHGGPDLGPTRARAGWAQLGVDGRGVADLVPEPGFVGMPRLTVAQAAIVQGFPEWWEIVGRKTAAYRQVGNAFPPPVAEAVGRHILLAIAAADADRTAVAV